MPNHVTNELTCEKKETLDSLSGWERTGKAEDIVDFETIIPMPDLLRVEADTSTIDWAKIAMGVIPIASLGKKNQSDNNLGDSFKKGEYGVVANELERQNLIRLLTQGPFPKDFDDTKFENLITCMRCLKQYGHPTWHDWSVENWGTKWNAYDQTRLSPVCVRFNTAWATPFEFVVALSKKFPSEIFRLRWADEDFAHNTGDVTIRDGVVIQGGRIQNNSREAHALAFELVYDGELPEEAEWIDGKVVWKEGE